MSHLINRTSALFNTFIFGVFLVTVVLIQPMNHRLSSITDSLRNTNLSSDYNARHVFSNHLLRIVNQTHQAIPIAHQTCCLNCFAIKYLIENSNYPHNKLHYINHNGLSLLHLATLRNHLPLVQLFLKTYHFDPNLTIPEIPHDQYNTAKTPLHYASLYSNDTAIITALLENNARPGLLDAQGFTFLHYLVDRTNRNTTSNQYYTYTIQLLITNLPYLQLKDKTGLPLILYIARTNQRFFSDLLTYISPNQNATIRASERAIILDSALLFTNNSNSRSHRDVDETSNYASHNFNRHTGLLIQETPRLR